MPIEKVEHNFEYPNVSFPHIGLSSGQNLRFPNHGFLPGLAPDINPVSQDIWMINVILYGATATSELSDTFESISKARLMGN